MSSLMSVYQKKNLSPVRADGSYLIDEKGDHFLDFTAGIGVVNLGHGNPEVKESVERQLNQYWHTSNLFHIPLQEEVAKKLLKLTGMGGVFFCNSGTEANEAAIKLARKATGKTKIITCLQSFHGRTFGSMAATAQQSIQEGFGPLPGGFEYVPFNDIDAIREVIDSDTAAVMLERVQGEGGVRSATPKFMEVLSSLCKESGVLLVIDEVQTGMGRTGYPFAYLMDDGVEPDIITTAKGLGNGLPIGAVIASQDVQKAFGFGAHGSTFGGNPVSLAASTVVLDKVSDPVFMDQVRAKANILLDGVREAAEDTMLVKEIRGEGLMIGIELNTPALPVIDALQEENLLVLSAGQNVIRLLPPLTVSEEEIEWALSKINKVFSAVHQTMVQHG